MSCNNYILEHELAMIDGVAELFILEKLNRAIAEQVAAYETVYKDLHL